MVIWETASRLGYEVRETGTVGGAFATTMILKRLLKSIQSIHIC